MQFPPHYCEFIPDDSTILDDWMTTYKERVNFNFFRPPVIFEMQGTSKQSLTLPVPPRLSVIKTKASSRGAAETTLADSEADKKPLCPEVRQNHSVCDIGETLPL
ncbi:unnamed protein product [Soboliphyme baturini]|uniref:UBX domain-containing protein n=1 Tax=Soboliphyme baturini TaxID=241478 RepID=A0A183J5D2_9BILA|nr:unnamed protein product [Soboliphyme baturini]